MQSAGERLKKIRQELNLTQAEFGSKLGLTSQGISNIEKDKSFFTLDKLQQLKDWNINLNYLVYGAGSMFDSCGAQVLKSSAAIELHSINEIEAIMLELLKKHGIIKS